MEEKKDVTIGDVYESEATTRNEQPTAYCQHLEEQFDRFSDIFEQFEVQIGH